MAKDTLKTQNFCTSKEALEYHYDLGNEFYRLWLDKNLFYTCAIWQENDRLESAQLRKVDYHCKQVQVKDAKRVLDVGCGWGGLLKSLVEAYNVEHAVGLTLNKPHLEWISAFNNPRIEVRLENWAGHSPKQPYDAIFAWGVMEHAAKPELSDKEKVEVYRMFFRRCHEWLKPGGRMSLQTITWGNARKEDSGQFLETEVFPETDFPRLAHVVEASERIFEITVLQNDREDYERTFRAWHSRLKTNRTAAINLVGEGVVSRFEKYMKLSIIGFHMGNADLMRITLRRIDNPCA